MVKVLSRDTLVLLKQAGVWSRLWELRNANVHGKVVVHLPDGSLAPSKAVDVEIDAVSTAST